MSQKIVVALLCLSTWLPLFAQQIQVNRDNKTIAITAEDSVSVDPEVVTITVGYENYAPTNKEAYEENVRVANQVTKALLNAGVPKAALHTENVELQRMEPRENWTADERKQRQFMALQTWTIYATVERAQSVVDVALGAGANELRNMDWNVSDPKALQAKAGAAALVKARTIAEQMAKGLNAKLGDLVYASNRAPLPNWAGAGETTVEVTSVAAPPPPVPHLLLYPKKVKADATVYAVFAIQ
jgi:uncharacterized protein